MKKEKLLWLVILFLLLLNASVIIFFLVGHGHHRPPGPNAGEIITEKLQLDKHQQELYRNMRDRHHAEMVRLGHQYDDLLPAYFDLLTRNYQSSEKDSLEHLLDGIQQQKVSITFAHFQDLKNICTPEQQQKFSVVMPEIIHVIIGRGGPAGGPDGPGGMGGPGGPGDRRPPPPPGR